MEKSLVYGLKCCESLATYDPESSSWRTYQLSFEWAAPRSLEVLPKSGITVNGQLYRLDNSALHICVKDGFALLPTPRATAMTDESIEGFLKRKAAGKVSTPKLATALRMLPTPSASMHKYRLKGDTQASRNLEAMARTGKLSQTGETGRLNPHFVEEMMGFPIGWLD